MGGIATYQGTDFIGISLDSFKDIPITAYYELPKLKLSNKTTAKVMLRYEPSVTKSVQGEDVKGKLITVKIRNESDVYTQKYFITDTDDNNIIVPLTNVPLHINKEELSSILKDQLYLLEPNEKIKQYF